MLAIGNRWEQNGRTMKTLSKAFRYVLFALAAVVFVVACATYAKSKGGVMMQKNGILILPEAKISKSDCDQLNAILKKFDKSLYRLETYRQGKLKNTEGALSDLCIDHAFVSKFASAKDIGLSDCTAQIGTCWGPDLLSKCPIKKKGAAELLERVGPLLQKYSKN
jgi:hypothetical protein